MIELVLTVCSIVSGAHCKDVALTYSEVSLMTCMMSGQTQVAQWIGQHPNWSVSKYTCQPAGKFANL